MPTAETSIEFSRAVKQRPTIVGTASSDVVQETPSRRRLTRVTRASQTLILAATLLAIWAGFLLTDSSVEDHSAAPPTLKEQTPGNQAPGFKGEDQPFKPSRESGGNLSAPLEVLDAQQDVTVVLGRVINERGKGVPNASVSGFQSQPGTPFRKLTHTGLSVISDEQGHFTLVGMPSDQPLAVEVTSQDLAPLLFEPFTVENHGTTNIGDLRLVEGISITGVVSAADLGVPLPNATLALSDVTSNWRQGAPNRPAVTAVTGEDGLYRFDHLARRQYDLQISAEGYAPLTCTFALALASTAEPTKHDFAMSPASSILGGTIFDPDGMPVTQLEVRLTRYERTAGTFFMISTLTNDRGVFRFETLPAGQLDLDLISEEWYLPRPETVMTDREDLAIVAQQARTIFGQLQVSSGDPPRNFIVAARPDGKTGAALVRGARSILDVEKSDPAGSFQFSGFKPGTYRLEVTATGFAKSTSHDLILDNQRTPVSAVIPITRGGLITGHLSLEQAGIPIEVRDVGYDPSRAVEATFPTPPLDGLTARTDNQGRFRIEYVPEGTYTVTALPPGLPPIHKRPVHVQEGQATDIKTVQMIRGGTITGYVYGQDGKPRHGARVTATGPHHHQQTTTDHLGHFLLEALPQGSYSIAATSGALWEALRYEALKTVSVMSDQEVTVQMVFTERERADH